MNGFEKFLKALDGQMTEPTAFGWFHLMFWGIMIATIVLLVIFARKVDDKKFRLILIITASILMRLEVYKQLNFSFNSQTGVWDYQWYAFPFQFCSTPMYIMLLAGLVKKGRFQDMLLTYLSTFCVFAGICVMIMPGDVFIETIGINIQTMIHHSAMVIIGIFILATGRVKLNIKNFLLSTLVFVGLVLIALLLNVILYNSGVLNGETFNMFFISPYFDCTLPLVSLIYSVVPYVVFLLIYIVGFCAAALIVFYLSKLVFFIIDKIKNKNNKTETTTVKTE